MDEKSMTIPDDSLTVRDIMERFTRGLPLEGVHRYSVLYDEGDDFDVNPQNTFMSFDEAFELVSDCVETQNKFVEFFKNRKNEKTAEHEQQLNSVLERNAASSAEPNISPPPSQDTETSTN